MNVISARSPFEIVINETGQTGSKIELFIWNKGTTEPTTPTRILSENIASATQTETNYNISPFVLEYISQTYVNYSTTPIVENNTDWCFARVKRYKNVSGTYTLLDNILYIGVNGYTSVIDGLNYDIAQSEDYCLLGVSSNDTYKIQYNTLIPYYNFLCVSSLYNDYRVDYYTSSGTLLLSSTILSGSAPNYFNYRIPLAYGNSAYCNITDDINGILYTIYTLMTCKIKLIVGISFI
jgi:hypothetical protein